MGNVRLIGERENSCQSEGGNKTVEMHAGSLPRLSHSENRGYLTPNPPPCDFGLRRDSQGSSSRCTSKIRRESPSPAQSPARSDSSSGCFCNTPDRTSRCTIPTHCRSDRKAHTRSAGATSPAHNAGRSIRRLILIRKSPLPGIRPRLAAGIKLIAPGIFLASQSATGCKLKFRLGRKPLPRPLRIRLGIRDRKRARSARFRLRRRLRPQRMPPIGTVHFRPFPFLRIEHARPAKLFRIRLELRLGHELFKLPVRHFVLVDVIRIERLIMNRQTRS